MNNAERTESAPSDAFVCSRADGPPDSDDSHRSRDDLLLAMQIHQRISEMAGEAYRRAKRVPMYRPFAKVDAITKAMALIAAWKVVVECMGSSVADEGEGDTQEWAAGFTKEDLPDFMRDE